jgi:hypothetical protein
MPKKLEIVKRRGRPVIDGKLKKIDWKPHTNFIWKNGDRDIAEKMGCSVVAVFLKRKALIAEHGDKFCGINRTKEGVKYSRAKIFKVVKKAA